MIGLVLVTHGRLADEFRAALEHVMGPQKQIEAITIGAEDDADLCRSDIIEAVNRVDSGNGVAILTDMFGGTPSNLAISCMSRPKVEVLAGINLPMLVKLAKVRNDLPLPEAIAAAQEAGRKYVTIRELPITNKRGLHARASAKFVQLVERFNADVTVTRNGETVGGSSIMGLMMLSAGPGTTITVSATGADAAEAITAIANLVGSKFGEGE
ncbi:MAG: HPr family phosphocarrier protein [Rhizobiales bacterium]|nr:HPr family phosphocarrier protein [Hyphomicrobiales bacterium]